MADTRRHAVKDVVRQDAAIRQLDPALLIALVAVQLGPGGGPGVGRRVVNVGLGTTHVTAEDRAVGQHLRGIVAKLGLGEIGNRRPGVGHGVVDLPGVGQILGPGGAAVFATDDEDLAAGQDVGAEVQPLRTHRRQGRPGAVEVTAGRVGGQLIPGVADPACLRHDRAVGQQHHGSNRRGGQVGFLRPGAARWRIAGGRRGVRVARPIDGLKAPVRRRRARRGGTQGRRHVVLVVRHRHEAGHGLQFGGECVLGDIHRGLQDEGAVEVQGGHDLDIGSGDAGRLQQVLPDTGLVIQGGGSGKTADDGEPLPGIGRVRSSSVSSSSCSLAGRLLLTERDLVVLLELRIVRFL